MFLQLTEKLGNVTNQETFNNVCHEIIEAHKSEEINSREYMALMRLVMVISRVYED